MQFLLQSTFYLPLVFTAVIFGIAPILLGLLGFTSFTYHSCVQSFLAGLILAFAYQLMALLPRIGGIVLELIVYYLFLNVAFASLGIICGILQGIRHRRWTKLTHALKLLAGHFYLSDKKGFYAGLWEGISRHSWELAQNLIGHIWAQSLNAIGIIQRVEFFEGATFSLRINQKERSGMSLGSFIYIAIDDNFKGVFRLRLIKDPLFMHEFGHGLDSRLFGIFYLPFIGLPSIISAMQSKQVFGTTNKAGLHKYKSYEMRANRKAAYFFNSYAVNWQDFELAYPRKSPIE
tara:strand:+ start:58 stop:927 length:870 start_codon:yes stop_codon:yes gene_type:complete